MMFWTSTFDFAAPMSRTTSASLNLFKNTLLLLLLSMLFSSRLALAERWPGCQVSTVQTRASSKMDSQLRHEGLQTESGDGSKETNQHSFHEVNTLDSDMISLYALMRMTSS